MQRPAALCGTLLLVLTCLACQSRSAQSDDHDTADQDTVPLPTREQDMARDAGERPGQVMDELGIKRGSKVADIIAGGGYYTYLLAERVGPEGMVYATVAQGLERRLKEGDLAGKTNIQVVDSLTEVAPGSLDAVLINRAYHLLVHPEVSFFKQLQTALKPGGTVGIVEVRLNKPRGHDMETHRMGEETVREEMEEGGFEFVGSSDLLANPDDPGTDFMEGKRHLADRMFLTFRKPEGSTAGR
jgi:predicted methyltransferase